MAYDDPEFRTFESSQSKDSDSQAANVRTLYRTAARSLQAEVRDYWLNHSFLHGYQWLYWSESSGRLDELPGDPDRVQATVNRLWPNTRTIISTLMQRKLQFEVPPSAADDSHVRGARLAETIATSVCHDHRWEELRENMLYAVWKGGTAALCVDWDEEAEDVTLDNNTQGDPLGKGSTYEEHLNITQFVVEPGVRYPEEARYWIKAVALPPEEVKDQFGLEDLPPADATAALAPFHRKMMGLDRLSDAETVRLTLVLTYYERPNPSEPEGKVCVVVDNQMVYEGEWPFPFTDRLNLVIVRETLRENRWTGDTVLSAARPLQTLLNMSWSSVAEHMKLAGNARLMVPYSSVEMMEQLTDLPGELVPYNDSLSVKPSYLSPPQMPGWWIQQPTQLASEIDDIMGVHDVSRGRAPRNIESGFGLTILAEKDATPIGRLTKETAEAFGRLMSMTLAIYEDKTKSLKVSRQATVRIPGNAPMDVQWNGKDLRGQTTAIVPEQVIMPRSRAAAMEFAKDMLQTYGPEEINPATFIALAELPNGRALLNVTSPDIDRARRENAHFGLGRQSIPYPWDNHETHIAEHNKFRKTVDFEMLSLEEQEIIEEHIKAHETLAAEEIGESRMRSRIDPALAMAPTSAEGPMVPPLEMPSAPGPAPGPAPITPVPEGLGQPTPTPEEASSEIMELMSQLRG